MDHRTLVSLWTHEKLFFRETLLIYGNFSKLFVIHIDATEYNLGQ